MTTATELIRPTNETEFQNLCLALYMRVWDDPTLMAVGRRGQKQFGLDIVGTLKARPAAIQCKCYSAKKFDLAVVEGDIKEADDAGIKIDHLLFATTAKNDANLVLKVKELSEARKAEGKFTVSVDFWDSICIHLYVHKEIGRAFIENFPGSDANRTRELVEQFVPIYAEDQKTNHAFHAEARESFLHTDKQLSTLVDQVGKLAAPQSKGSEVNKLVAKQLDLVREKLRQDRAMEAREILASIKDEALSADNFTKFRWHTNEGACLLGDDREAEAAQQYLTAFDFAPDEEKALGNRARALLLLGRLQDGLDACEAGLAAYPNSALIWALKLNARQLLKHAQPEAGLPEAVANSSDVLHALSIIRQQQGRFEEAYAFSLRQYELDKSSIGSKRSVLISALSWATKDDVRAHFRHLSSEQIAAIKSAISIWEPIENAIENLQRRSVVHEVTTNIAVALQIHGQGERAQLLVERGLRYLPTAEGLLGLRIQWLDRNDDLAAIRQLTDPILEALPTDLLIRLSEVAGNRGEVEWHGKIGQILNGRYLSDSEKQDLRAMSACAVWKAGRRSEAIRLTTEQLKKDSRNPLLSGIFARMLKTNGEDRQAKKWAKHFAKLAKQSGSHALVIQAADIQWDFGNFFDAAELYGRILNAPGNDHITRRYLICLLESDQREKARRVIASLRLSDRETSDIRRIEAHLALKSGDWERCYDLLKTEIVKTPGESAVAIGYLGALRVGEKITEIKSYLASNPIFERTSAANEFEFAKYQSQFGFAFDGLMRLYRLFRQHPNDATIAGYLLSVLLLGDSVSEKMVVDVAVPGTAVLLTRPGDSRWIALEVDGLPNLVSWPEVLPGGTAQGQQLLGKKIGDKVVFDSGLNNAEYEISALEHILLFASRKAQEIIAANAAPGGPLWSARILKDDGEPDVELIIESLKRRSLYVENVFKVYRERRLSIVHVADALGTDPVTLLLEWPHKHTAMFVSRGTFEERESERDLLRNVKVRVVLDILALAELVRWEVFDAACAMLGRPLVPRTIKEQLIGILQSVEHPRAAANMREENGQLIWTDIPEAHFVERKEFLKRMLDTINEKCELAPTFGPGKSSKSLRLLPQILDSGSLDAVYLSLEHKAKLISEDATFRMLADETGVVGAVGIQPLLMNLRDEGRLASEEYSRIILSKLALGHDFISVEANDLYWAVKQSNENQTGLLRAALNSFRRPTIDLPSAVLVCAEFLRLAAQDQPVATVAKMYRQCKEVLADGRESVKDGIAQVLKKGMSIVLSHMEPPRALALGKELGMPVREPNLESLRQKLLIIAIRRALYSEK